MVEYQVQLPDRNYSFTIDTSIFTFELDTSQVYIGDPILFSYVSKAKRERFQMYIGTKDPIPDWKSTFDFKEMNLTLEQQVKRDTTQVFIRKQSIEYWDCPGSLVEYSEYKWKKIESQFTCFKEVRLNVVFSGDINVGDNELLLDFKTAMKSIKVNGQTFR